MTTIPLRGSTDLIGNPLLGEPFHFVTPTKILESSGKARCLIFCDLGYPPGGGFPRSNKI